MRALILSRLLVDYSRVMFRAMTPRRRNAEGLADAVLIAAVYVGQTEGRPMSAHKLSQFCGITRPTVVRKIRELVAAGLLEIHNGAPRIPLHSINSDAFRANTKELAAIVNRAARDLSKLDTKPIAPRRKK